MDEITRSDDRYVMTSEDGREIGHISVVEGDGVIEMPHTVVHPEFEGQGKASQLARHAMDDARARGLKVLPACPYLDAWMRRHPDYEDLRA